MAAGVGSTVETVGRASVSMSFFRKVKPRRLTRPGYSIPCPGTVWINEVGRVKADIGQQADVDTQAIQFGVRLELHRSASVDGEVSPLAKASRRLRYEPPIAIHQLAGEVRVL